MNAHKNRFSDYFLLVIGLLALLNLTACSQLSNKKTTGELDAAIDNKALAWVLKPPKSNASYDRVVTLPINGNIQQTKALALSKGANKIRQQVNAEMQAHYLKTLSSVEDSYGEFEHKIRTKVRDSIPSLQYAQPKIKAVYENKATKELSVWVQLTKKDIASSLGDTLLAADKKLHDFIHVSERGSDLAQLLSVLPALPALETRQRARDALSVFLKKPISLNSDELAGLLNTYITHKFDELMVNLQATTADSKPFEIYLQQSLIKQGVPVSVRRPDLIIKYFLEFDDDGVAQGKQKISLVADAEMINDLGGTFASVSKEYPAMAKSTSDARKQAMDAFTADIAQAIINATMNYIDRVNKSQASQRE
ncbi:hypothetical protein [Hydrogenovibrio kuenenii]|uniref:hypothetical protein n=1 Tax=Hydrogenovibrio kuenenii TaxID=63658 RepID=UPI000464EACE|nr:hypothetical protein [Hydrogenovibrio kuenenii]